MPKKVQVCWWCGEGEIPEEDRLVWKVGPTYTPCVACRGRFGDFSTFVVVVECQPRPIVRNQVGIKLGQDEESIVYPTGLWAVADRKCLRDSMPGLNTDELGFVFVGPEVWNALTFPRVVTGSPRAA